MAQLAEAVGSNPARCGFESPPGHHDRSTGPVLWRSNWEVSTTTRDLEPLDDRAGELVGEAVPTLDELLASAPGPDADHGIALSDEEFTSFLDAALGRSGPNGREGT